jgi:NAD(P)-dependent dehydrogenase (short-subunit alcohol dehydrogenase family)
MALQFSREGAKVVAADVNERGAAETIALVQQAGGEGISTLVDVTNPTSVEQLIALAHTSFGSLDILCNNAGIGSTTDVVDCTPDEWDRVMAVNVRGVYLGCKYAIPVMLQQGSGCIINTASVAGMVGIVKRAVYCASKGAVIALTKQVAVEYVEQGIRCNCICPGTVDSPWVGRLLDQTDDPQVARAALVARQPIGRLGTPEEVAAAALYLASPDASFITGSSLVLDGGWTAK